MIDFITLVYFIVLLRKYSLYVLNWCNLFTWWWPQWWSKRRKHDLVENSSRLLIFLYITTSSLEKKIFRCYKNYRTSYKEMVSVSISALLLFSIHLVMMSVYIRCKFIVPASKTVLISFHTNKTWRYWTYYTLWINLV